MTIHSQPSATLPPPSGTDIPITVRGYITDPQRVGYQILTNYESTYWAPLVGNDGWRLYEVLRSFCHQGNSTCHPSINLLLSILGITDRSVLIGRAKLKTVKGKQYRYPGLIQILQDHNLVVAEVEGEGPKMRYIYHLNMTPGLLSDQQLSQLPNLLQKKHDQLLERCEEEQKTLEAKKRPSKLSDETALASPQTVSDRGIGISNTPLGNSNTPSWNFQYKQHLYNNTHRTDPRARVNSNNNIGDASNVVVALLTQQGISEKVADRLAHCYSQEQIAEKIAYLEFLQAEDPDKVQNPHELGWLRRAIEENYTAPDGYLTKEEQELRVAEAAQLAQEEEARVRADEKSRHAFQEGIKVQQEANRQKLQEQYGTTEEDVAFWKQVQWEISCTAPPDVAALVTEMEILTVKKEVVVICVARQDVWRQLQHPGTKKAIRRALSQVAGRPVELEVALVAQTPCSA